MLTEIVSRALSPAVNDPGTAIDILGLHVPILSQWRERSDAEVRFGRVFVPRISVLAPLRSNGQRLRRPCRQSLLQSVNRRRRACIISTSRTETTIAVLSWHGPGGTAATGRGLLLNANRSVASVDQTTHAQEFTLADWRHSCASERRISALSGSVSWVGLRDDEEESHQAVADSAA